MLLCFARNKPSPAPWAMVQLVLREPRVERGSSLSLFGAVDDATRASCIGVGDTASGWAYLKAERNDLAGPALTG